LGESVRGNAIVVPLGFEPRLTDSESTSIALFSRENGTLSDCAAPGAALEHENALIDPTLQAVIDGWPELPEAVKAGILAMVQAASRAEP
jgi:hypothetical protein